MAVNKGGTSLSVLIPSQDALDERNCIEEQYYKLLDWFKRVEVLAWEKVNKYYGANNRPNSIFLVMGQTLSPSYAIAHTSSSSAECEVILEAKAGLPDALEAETFATYKFEKAFAAFGFQQQTQNSGDKKYVIFFDGRSSSPIRMFKSNFKPLLELYRCVPRERSFPCLFV